MTRLCLFGDGPAVPNGSRCRKHGGNPGRPSAHQRGYTEEWRRKVQAAIEAQPWCSRCGATEDLTGDHPIPLSMGGSKHQGPVVMCRRCNSAKGGANRVRGEQHG